MDEKDTSAEGFSGRCMRQLEFQSEGDDMTQLLLFKYQTATELQS